MLYNEDFDIHGYTIRLHRMLCCLLTMSTEIEDDYFGIDNRFYFCRPKYMGDNDKRVEFRIVKSATKGNAGDEDIHILQVTPGKYNKKLMTHPFFNDDYCSIFLHFNTSRGLHIDTQEMRLLDKQDESNECPVVDLMQEDGRFQYLMIMPVQSVNALAIYQYFFRINFQPFSTWFHEDFEELYGVLDEKYRISEDDSIFCTRIL